MGDVEVGIKPAVRSIALIALVMVFICGCGYSPKQKFRREYYGLFDTYIEFSAYTDSEEEFDKYAEIVGERILELHRKFDIYNEYEGLGNIMTINENAGNTPVSVDDDIMGLLEFSKSAYYETEGAVNIALGPVLAIWHEYREKGLNEPQNAKLPPMDALRDAAQFTDIEGVVIDAQNKTVFLNKVGMSLNVGAVAKGYAAKLALDTAHAEGLASAVLNAGGNIVTLGAPADGKRERWAIGVANPGEGGGIADTVYITDMSVVTSGAYQRFYTAHGVDYGHIIDPDTLYPADKYTAVVVLHEDSGVADMLSTACFILPIEKSKPILEKYGAEALWIETDGILEATDGYKAVSKEYGAKR